MSGTACGRAIVRHVWCAHPGGLHRMAYREWSPAGGEERRTVVCAHGLTRNGGDFDALAEVLVEDGFRVICPDIAGRGLSDRLPDAALYDVPQYVADCLTLLARLDRERVDWIGTSMGGLIGMALAGLGQDPESGPSGATLADVQEGVAERAARQRPIARMLLNDVGPFIARAGLERIAGYVGKGVPHPDFATAEASMRGKMATFGPHDELEFRLLSRHYFVERGGEWTAHYDPAIASPFSRTPLEDIDLWAMWRPIDCPVTVMRGGESDLLDAATAECMTRGGPDGIGPHATRVTIEGVGHAPTLIARNQIDVVRRFLADEAQPPSVPARDVDGTGRRVRPA